MYYEGLFIEIIIFIEEWLLSWSCKSHKNNIGTHLQAIGQTLEKLSTSYDNISFLDDFNIESEEAKMSKSLNIYSVENVVSQKTCFKNPENLL